MKPPQALLTTYPSRLATFSTPLLVPPSSAPTDSAPRRTKRGTTSINYAELDADPDAPSPPPPPSLPPPPTLPDPKPLPARPPPIFHPPHILAGAAARPTTLVPIRLDLDLPHGKLHDTFLWNLHESLVTPDAFAHTMCLDLALAPACAPVIAAAIREQCAEYAAVAVAPAAGVAGVCELTVALGDVVYEDRFEWLADAAEVAPEEFARGVVRDVGLRPEFATAIAAGIYEWVLRRKKEVYDGVAGEWEAGGARGEGVGGWRVDGEGLGVEWEPRVEVLRREEMEKRELDRERETRRLRRETARFGMVEEEGRRGRRKRGRSGSPVAGEDWERRGWRCGWCGVPGVVAWATGDGPDGERSLCWGCAAMWRDGALGEWAKGLHGPV